LGRVRPERGITVKYLLRLCLILAVVSPVVLHAQQTRSWVSGVGDDINPCTRTAPCKTFAAAISRTAAGGEIDALDPGSFGQVTITKAITIDGGAGLASVLAAAGNGITVSAGLTDDVIILHISFNGVGSGAQGIVFNSGRSLTVEDCSFKFFTEGAVLFDPGSGSSQLTVRNSIFDRNIGGIAVENGSASLDHIQLNGNALFGLDVIGKAIVSNSSIEGNSTGVKVDIGSDVNLAHTVIASNTIGIDANQNASVLTISDVDASHNQTGISTKLNGGAVIFSYGDNLLGPTPVLKLYVIPKQ
jgi:hypothetical protein